MKIRLDRVRQEPFSWEEERQIAASDLNREEVLELGPIHWQGKIHYAAPGFALRARVEYRQTLLCMRCLGPAPQMVDAETELAIFVGSGDLPPGEYELTDDELGTVRVEEESLETDPLLFEQLQLNIPMKPLCRPDCRGLCPICGADLNATSCGCEGHDIDPRWAALSAFKGKLS